MEIKRTYTLEELEELKNWFETNQSRLPQTMQCSSVSYPAVKSSAVTAVGIVISDFVHRFYESQFKILVVGYGLVFVQSFCHRKSHNRVICEKTTGRKEGELFTFMVVKFKS